MQIGEKIKMLMDEKGWTIYRLAKVTGYSQSTVARWVNGEGVPQKMTMVRIAEAFGVPVAYLQDENAKTPVTDSDDGRNSKVGQDAELEEINQMLQKSPAWLRDQVSSLLRAYTQHESPRDDDSKSP